MHILLPSEQGSSTIGEDEGYIEDDIVDCIIAMPSSLFYSTGIPVCIWILNRSKENSNHRSRKGETLFIDARKMGEMVTRKLRELTDDDITTIAETYHNWRNVDGAYEDKQGFCKSASLEEIRGHEYILTPGRYVGIEEVEDDGIPFVEKMENLTSELAEQFVRSRELEEKIRENLKSTRKIREMKQILE
jgi:type I restriction enzyme M protein